MPLANGVWGLDCKVLTTFFSTSMYGSGATPWIKVEKTRCCNLQYGLRNDVSKMFTISLANWIDLESTPQTQAVCSLEYRPLNQPTTQHIVPERPERLSYKNYQTAGPSDLVILLDSQHPVKKQPSVCFWEVKLWMCCQTIIPWPKMLLQKPSKWTLN